MKFPVCITEVTVDAEGIKDGDYAGMCALQGCYGMAAVTKRDGRMLLVMRSLEAEHDSIEGNQGNSSISKWIISQDAEWDCLPMQRKKQGESQNSADSDIFNKKFPPRHL